MSTVLFIALIAILVFAGAALIVSRDAQAALRSTVTQSVLCGLGGLLVLLIGIHFSNV